MYKYKVRAFLAAIPLTALVFLFGMIQVVGVEQSYATARNLFQNFSLLGASQPQQETFVVNGREFHVKVGHVDGNGHDTIAEYNNYFDRKKMVHPTEDGGHIVHSSGDTITHVAVGRDKKNNRTQSMEVVAREVVTERQRAIAEDPVVQKIISDVKAAGISPQRISSAIKEYIHTQKMSDIEVAAFFEDLYIRIDEIKREIDVPGRDLEGIVRYPGSVRVLDISRRANSIRLLAYEHRSSLSSTVEHYKSVFRQEGWASVEGFELGSAANQETQVLLFTRPDKVCLFSASITEEGTVKSYLMNIHGFNLDKG